MTEKFTHPLGLKLSEFRLILDCLEAARIVPNGHYLPATRWNKAAKRMIKLGYLTEAPDQFSPPQPDWIVVFLSKENAEKYNADLNAAWPAYEKARQAGAPVPEERPVP